MINGGARVPVVVFLSEDWQEVCRYGERTLSIYRKLAADQLGPSCPTGLVPPANEALATITAEWLAEFERAHLILRLSPRLREARGLSSRKSAGTWYYSAGSALLTSRRSRQEPGSQA